MKPKLLFFILTLATLIGCSKSKITGPYKTAIIGKWAYSADSVIVIYNGRQSYYPGLYNYPGNYYQFNKNGTGTLVLDNQTRNFNYQLSEAQLTINVLAGAENGMTAPAYIETAMINQLDGSSLNLTITYKQSDLEEQVEYANFIKQ